MKKRFLSCVAVAMVMMFLSVGSVFAADDAGKNFMSNKVGVGYQGFFGGNLLNGLSVRGWIGDRVGLELTGFYGTVSGEVEEYGYKNSFDADLWLIEAKAMYAFLVRSNSKFYAGGKIGYGQIGASVPSGLPFNIDEIANSIDGTSLWTPGLFVGAEWNFPGLPELGLNFDVGYQWLLYNNKLHDDPYVYLDLSLSGITTTFGIHYYF